MKRGTKIKQGYITIDDDPDALHYFEISRIMNALGYRMNYTATRAFLLDAMKKFARSLTSYYGVRRTNSDLADLAKKPDFQKFVSDALVGAISRRDRKPHD